MYMSHTVSKFHKNNLLNYFLFTLFTRSKLRLKWLLLINIRFIFILYNFLFLVITSSSFLMCYLYVYFHIYWSSQLFLNDCTKCKIWQNKSFLELLLNRYWLFLLLFQIFLLFETIIFNQLPSVRFFYIFLFFKLSQSIIQFLFLFYSDSFTENNNLSLV